MDNKWHHIAATREVKGGANELKIYVDGKLEATGGGGSIKQHNQDTTPVRIGTGDECCGEGGAAAYFLKGILDEVAIYRKTLTAAEIQADMTDGLLLAIEPAGKLATTWGHIKSTLTPAQRR